MGDREGRELERLVAQGDTEAELKLRRVREREQYRLLHSFIKSMRKKTQKEGMLTVLLSEITVNERDSTWIEPMTDFAKVWRSDETLPCAVERKPEEGDAFDDKIVLCARDLRIVEDSERTIVFLIIPYDEEPSREEIEDLFPRLVEHFQDCSNPRFAEEDLDNPRGILSKICDAMVH